MKKTIYAIAILLVAGSMFLSSCRYKDGPKFTVRSAKFRVVNEWKMDKCLENGVDKTADFKALFSDWKLILREDNTYTLSYNFFVTIVENGKWEFLEDGLKLNLREDGTGTNTWTIDRLKANDMWTSQKQSNGDMIEYHLKP